MSTAHTIKANGTQRAKLPAINIPPNVDGQLRVALEAMKERLEVREGSRGNPYERAATMRDLEALTKTSQAATSAPQPSTTEGGLTPEQARAIFNTAMASESSRLRSAIATVDREMRDAMDRLVNGSGDSGISALQAMAYSAVNRYTQTQLADDLAAGAATIFAGAASGTTVMELDPAGNYVLFKHRDANLAAPIGGTAYTGMVRTAVGITAAGFIAGYNRLSDGAWQTSIVIDSSTGNVTILGTLKAGSVIEAGATIGVGGVTIGDVASDASTALSEVSGKLEAGSSYVLTGAVSLQDTGGIKAGTSLTWNSTTGAVTGGSGVVLTENGLTGVKSGVVKFSITNAGDATFAGDINTGGDAYFAGLRNSAVSLDVGGSTRLVDYTSWSNSVDSSSTPAGKIRAGVVGYSSNVNASYSVGVLGRAIGTVNGIGVFGQGDRWGGFFQTTIAGGTALEAANTAGGLALAVIGSATFSSSINAAGNITAYGSSDMRLKKNVKPIQHALAKVEQLRGVMFDWKAKYVKRQGGADGYFMRVHDTGVIAQEVERVMPEIVATREDGTLAVKYEKLTPLLIEAIKELSARVRELEAKCQHL